MKKNYELKEVETTRRNILKIAGGGACLLFAGGALAGGRKGRGKASDAESSQKSSGSGGGAVSGKGNQDSGPNAQKGFMRPVPASYFSVENAKKKSLRCELCPNRCLVENGERGLCRVRENREGKPFTLAHGNPALLQIDPLERKPFFHVLPGTRSLSVTTTGCNMTCKFCEVWDMALVSPEDVYAYDFPPERIVSHVKENGLPTITFTLGEPVVFFEYMRDIAKKASGEKIKLLFHSNGFIQKAPLEELCGFTSAANIDLKSFDPDFYRSVCGGRLEPVRKTLKALRKAGLHLEITNLLIPTLNDNMEKLGEMCRWIRDELGASTPLHFRRFYPLYRLANLPPTPLSTINAACEAADKAGLEYVYVNLPGHRQADTRCPKCSRILIRRIGFMVESMHVKDGACPDCGNNIPGIW